MTRDIPFDEEVAERGDHYRETFGGPSTEAERAQAHAAVRRMFEDADRRRAASLAQP